MYSYCTCLSFIVFVSFTVDNGADINLRNTVGSTVLHLCAKLNNLSTMDYVLQLPGCEVNIQSTQSKYTPLHEALDAQNEAAALHLIDAGCDVNMKAATGCVPLAMAVTKQCLEVFQTLLRMKTVNLNGVSFYFVTE